MKVRMKEQNKNTKRIVVAAAAADTIEPYGE